MLKRDVTSFGMLWRLQFSCCAWDFSYTVSKILSNLFFIFQEKQQKMLSNFFIFSQAKQQKMLDAIQARADQAKPEASGEKAGDLHIFFWSLLLIHFLFLFIIAKQRFFHIYLLLLNREFFIFIVSIKRIY